MFIKKWIRPWFFFLSCRFCIIRDFVCLFTCSELCATGSLPCWCSDVIPSALLVIMADHSYHREAKPNASPCNAKKRKGGRMCAVGYCSNTSYDGVSVHEFPKDPSIRRQWVRFVQVCRADFGQASAKALTKKGFLVDVDDLLQSHSKQNFHLSCPFPAQTGTEWLFRRVWLPQSPSRHRSMHRCSLCRTPLCTPCSWDITSWNSSVSGKYFWPSALIRGANRNLPGRITAISLIGTQKKWLIFHFYVIIFQNIHKKSTTPWGL